MVQRCFRHQHPEAYGGAQPAEPDVPSELRYGSDSNRSGGEHRMQEPMGAPDAVLLD